MPSQDELTASICSAVQQLTQIKKADFLLNVALALIEEGRYGKEVENYFDVYLKTPGLPEEDIAKALLARGNAQRERVFAKSQQDFQAVLRLDPLKIDAQRQLRGKDIHLATDPCHQAPLEIWELIAAHTPKYHLRTWLFVSPFHRDIASRHIFHTVDIYFGADKHHVNRGVGIFDRAKDDPVFASRVKLLRLHWNYDVGVISDLIMRVFKTSLPAFKALRDFEWIGFPSMGADIVQVLLNTHRDLHGLGLIGSQFTASGVSAFDKLRRFNLRIGTEEIIDVGEIRTLFDRNERTLKHLTLGASPGNPGQSWDLAFNSVIVNNLTHLHLVDMSISDFLLSRIALAHNLLSLTLIGSVVDPNLTPVVFTNDRIVDGTHTSLPHLEAFRFDMVDQGDDDLYDSVTRFLQKRERLRRLDLGHCPWEMVLAILPDLKNLRVLSARIHYLSQEIMKSLVESIPTQMEAICLAVLFDPFLNDYARYFTRFNLLSFLHIRACVYEPSPRRHITREDYQAQKHRFTCSIAAIIPSLDFLALYDELYVVVRELKQLSLKSLEFEPGINVGGEDAAWLERTDVPFSF